MKCFLQKAYRSLQKRDITVFLLECRKGEERQTNFPSKEASQSVLEMRPVLLMVPF